MCGLLCEWSWSCVLKGGVMCATSAQHLPWPQVNEVAAAVTRQRSMVTFAPKDAQQIVGCSLHPPVAVRCCVAASTCVLCCIVSLHPPVAVQCCVAASTCVLCCAVSLHPPVCCAVLCCCIHLWLCCAVSLHPPVCCAVLCCCIHLWLCCIVSLHPPVCCCYRQHGREKTG